MQADKHTLYARVDRIFETFSKWLVYLGAVILILIMLIAFADVIAAKVFGSSIPYATDFITYLDVPLAYLGMGYTLLIGQMTSVDILYGHFSGRVKKTLSVVYDVLGLMVSGFLCKLSIDNAVKYILSGSAISPKGSFPVWPFAVLAALSWLTLTLAFLFCVCRGILAWKTSDSGEENEV